MFLNETKITITKDLICLQPEALTVAVPNGFIFVVGRCIFEVENCFCFNVAFFFVICKTEKPEVIVTTVCCFFQ